MKLKRLTLQAFNRVAASTRMGSQACAMARAVLVDGRAQVDVAIEHGMSKQRINRAVATIKQAYKKTVTPEESTIRVEMDMPEVLALEMEILIDAIKECNNATKATKAIAETASAMRKAVDFLAH